MAKKSDKEKLRIIHITIGVVIAVIALALSVAYFASTSDQREEQKRENLKEQYQSKLESCYNTAIANNKLAEQSTGTIGDHYCSMEFIEDKNNHATGVIIYYTKGLNGEKTVYFRSDK